MKEHEVKILLITVLFVVVVTLISGMSKELSLLIIIADILAYMLIVLSRLLDEIKRKGGKA